MIGNDGAVASRPNEIVVGWYDADDHYLGRSVASVPSLAAGMSWFAVVEHREAFEVAEFEATVRGQQADSALPEVVTIEEYTLDEARPGVTGLCANTRETSVPLTLTASVYRSSWLSHTGSASATIPAATTWRFLIRLENVDGEDASLGDDVRFFARGGE
ncbi:hypothetical protein AArcSl_1616 [Halalkaliarchaeum desulfuricum]|uniref:Uncharacterized protein n=1 Tax=Halalkaliarchaeum desulfuricum TaxID=2055893 RepID=A0A343TJH3_9EURY|nr:FxLYD domain-containing protein [Halalkaliarchaeum desulfuricum]AUX09245.1 hypothetical protein AArcSl_1616 [Halalkaliarchaeum desulfuricum]